VQVSTTEELHHAEGPGFRASRKKVSYGPGKYTPEKLRDEMGFEMIEWDSKCAPLFFFSHPPFQSYYRSTLLLVDRKKRIIAVAAGPPADGFGEHFGASKPSFAAACDEFARFIHPANAGKGKRRRVDDEERFKDNRRGAFEAINFGVNLGIGHTVRVCFDNSPAY
jgi:hypothetical protein